MTAGLWVLVVAAVSALGFGGYRAMTDGRFRGTRSVRAGSAAGAGEVEVVQTPWAQVVAAVSDAQPGERATLVQFSSAFCAPCRATRRTLSEVADLVPGVTHLEIDAEHHLELVRQLNILRTPTTLVLDAAGREITRASGAPRKEQVLAALGRID